MKVFIFGALVTVAVASHGSTTGGQSYIQQIKKRNSHLSHPPATHNPPVPELYAVGTQAQFTQFYEGSPQDSYTQFYAGTRQPPASEVDVYSGPEPEENEYQPGYGEPSQLQQSVAPAYPQPQQRASTTSRPISYPQPTQRITTKSSPGANSYQNAIEDEEGIPENGYRRLEKPSTTRRPPTYPQISTTVRKVTTSTTQRPSVGSYPQPAREGYIQPINSDYPRLQRKASTTRRPITYSQPTIRSTATTRRTLGDYPGTALDEIDIPDYSRLSRNNLLSQPTTYTQPVQKKPPTGYDNDIEDTDQGAYGRRQQTVQPATVITRPIGGYSTVDINEVEQSGYIRPQIIPSTSPPVPKQPTGGYPSAELDQAEQGGYVDPSRQIKEIPTGQSRYPNDTKPRPKSILPPRKIASSGYPSASELPNPAAASRSQNDFVGGRLSAGNPDYFPQVSLSRAAWPASPAVAPIPAFSSESLNYRTNRHQPVEYVILNGEQQW